MDGYEGSNDFGIVEHDMEPIIPSNIVRLRAPTADELADLASDGHRYTDAGEMDTNGLEALAAAVTADKLAALESERLMRNESEVDAAQRIFRESTVAVAQSVVNIAIHGRNERARLTAQGMILDRVMGRVQDNPPDPVEDPFLSLLAKCVREVSPDEAKAQIKADLKKGEGE